MNTLWDVVFAVLAGFGGIGAIITGVVYFSSNFIADRLQKRYDLKLSEELEKYKANLENKNYISKTKFDTEFAIYRSLSRAYFNMVKCINILIPTGLEMVPADKEAKEKYDKERYKNAVSAVAAAQDEINGNAAFIPEKFFDEYEKIKELCNAQLAEFDKRWDLGYLASKEEKEHIPMEAYKRTDEINTRLRKLNSEIREYLEKLDVLE